MAGQRIGYVRVSTLDQNERRQLEGQVLDRVFTDKASGRDTSRPELTELLRFARDGDTLVVHSMDRLARNPHTAKRVRAGPTCGNRSAEIGPRQRLRDQPGNGVPVPAPGQAFLKLTQAIL